jgi:hypothetical protein
MTLALRLAAVTLVTGLALPITASAAPMGFLPAPTDGSLVSPGWTRDQLAAAGLALDPRVFGASTWQVRENTSLGVTGRLYVLNDDLTLNDGDLLHAGSFIYYSANPVLNYAFHITDSGAPSSFGFMMTAAIVPPALGLHDIRVDFAAGLSDGGTDGVGFTPLAPPTGIPVDADGIPEAQVFTFNRSADPAGVWINAGHDLGRAASLATFGMLTEGPSTERRDFLQPWDEWRFDLNFTGTGGGDAYGIVGRAEIRFVPVPAAVWLLASALAGGLAVVRRRG